ncbi:ABC transporter substrate-binding protein [Nocardioides lentus]|uniref:ABC transporter substrate-binding protein n=1 Tax=Nocardioides lentus TaxID=338077 RepID=A0ABN2PKH4_9ACTN
MPRRTTLAAAAASTVLGLTACGSGTAEEAPTSESSGDYPVTVENCGAEVTFEAAPERVLLLKSASVPYLHALGVMDRVTARAGVYPDEYYDEATRAELDDVELLTDDIDASGHLLISQEVVISQEPDLVMGAVDNIPRESLADVAIPMLEEPVLCDTEGAAPSFADITTQMETYGRVFGREEEAAAAAAEVADRLAAVEEQVPADEDRTAAVLFPTVGGGVTYAYGAGSMADPQLEAAGLENVFGDVDERVFEVTLEELLGRDPDLLVLLHSEGDPEGVEQAVRDLPGADELTAVREDAMLPMLLNFTEPPTPLSVDGLERIVETFAEPGRG